MQITDGQLVVKLERLLNQRPDKSGIRFRVRRTVVSWFVN
jgi:hypothetical protein